MVFMLSFLYFSVIFIVIAASIDTAHSLIVVARTEGKLMDVSSVILLQRLCYGEAK